MAVVIVDLLIDEIHRRGQGVLEASLYISMMRARPPGSCWRGPSSW
jgi:hypothetical protein